MTMDQLNRGNELIKKRKNLERLKERVADMIDKDYLYCITKEEKKFLLNDNFFNTVDILIEKCDKEFAFLGKEIDF